MLRDYQIAARRAVYAHWREGARGVLLVSPTGSGKTMMGTAIVRDAVSKGADVLWVAHRTELLTQARDTLRDVYDIPAGIVAPGFPHSPSPVQVTSVQTLLSRGRNGREPGLLVLDEGHHYGAAEWSEVAKTGKKVLGLTATPERSDGKPLDFFDRMVVAAKYSELLEAGHLVPCKVFRPEEALMQGVAQDPVRAYQAHGEGGQAFVYAPSVELAYEWTDAFASAGIPARCIEQNTHSVERAACLQDFREGVLRVLVNVFVLTEGVDVPAAQVCILGRGVGHVTPYLQMCGRVLRPSGGKEHGILIDLAGASFQHGLPTEDREYTLTHGIKPSNTSNEPALRVCIKCGMTFISAPKCPSCGFTPATKVARPTIYDMALREVFEGEQTPQLAKNHELERLMEQKAKRGWSMGFVVREYGRLFGGKPDLSAVPMSEKRKEFDALARQAKERQYNEGWISHRFRSSFGHWPPRGWSSGSD